PETVIEQYGTDALRQWAAIGGSVGSDVPYSTNDLKASSRFLTKLWNIFRFSMLHFSQGVQPVIYGSQNPSEIWLICNLIDLVDSVTSSMDRFAFDEALKEIRSFVWNTLADHYIEAVKGRLYERDAYCIAALHLALNTIVKLLAPFCPFFSEELFSHINPGSDSVHLHSWPVLFLKPLGAISSESTPTQGDVQQIAITASQKEVQEARRTGELVKEIIASVRRYKSEQRIALNARIEGIYVYLDRDMSYGAPDISNALNADIEYRTGEPDISEYVTEIGPNLGSLGPRFKSEVKRVVELIKSTPAKEIADQIATGSIMIDGREFLPTDFIVKKEWSVEGMIVDVIKLSEGTILINRM
ncbi:MAG: class I tRNA ligase family protein, partial [Euryarchaeota archaeon]|nr:class I tRNA ligase family protein [Euryarchaeota archaeon]